MNKGKKLFELFISFFKIGLFTFGGGLAMLPLFQHEFVEKKKWLTDGEFADLIAIAESTPGPIAINSATYIGYKAGKTLGSIIATLAVCLPSLVIIYIISLFFNSFLENQIVANAFKGIQAAVTFLILSAGIKMFSKLKKSAFNIVMFVLAFALTSCFALFSIKFSSVFLILIGALIGVVFYSLTEKEGQDV